MKLLLLVLLILFCILFLSCLLIYLFVFRSPNRTQNDDYAPNPGDQYARVREQTVELIDRFHKISFEEVWITSFDGLRLRGRYHQTAEGAPVALLIHGYRGTAGRDFCGGAQLAIECGQNVLAVDLRGCGKSGGHTISFGINETQDCLDWIRYLADRFGSSCEIYLYGISMGGYTVLRLSGEDLPENVKKIVADSPYNSPEEIIRDVGHRMAGLPMDLLYPLVRVSAKLFGRLDLRDEKASDAVRRTKIPILIIHGEDDRFVPCRMSLPPAEANPSMVRRETFPEAGHGLSFLIDRGRYSALVREFLAN